MPSPFRITAVTATDARRNGTVKLSKKPTGITNANSTIGNHATLNARHP